MRKSNPARNSLIIAAVIFAVITSFFAIDYVRTNNKTESYNALPEKDEKLNTPQLAQEPLNDLNASKNAQEPEGKENKTAEKDAIYKPAVSGKDVIEIKEKMFITQINDVYMNAEDYLGKTIKLEGIFKSELYYGKKEPYCFVIRYGPGCCSNDGSAGFEIKWDKNRAQKYPAIDSWVEAAGELKSYEEDGYMQYLYLDLSSLVVLKKRGAETVWQ